VGSKESRELQALMVKTEKLETTELLEIRDPQVLLDPLVPQDHLERLVLLEIKELMVLQDYLELSVPVVFKDLQERLEAQDPREK